VTQVTGGDLKTAEIDPQPPEMTPQSAEKGALRSEMAVFAEIRAFEASSRVGGKPEKGGARLMARSPHVVASREFRESAA